MQDRRRHPHLVRVERGLRRRRYAHPSRTDDVDRAGARRSLLGGIDDFAIRRGHDYGTILIDLEQGRVIDMLKSRDSTDVEAWLNPQSTSGPVRGNGRSRRLSVTFVSLV